MASIFEDFIQNQFVSSLLNQYKESEWLRISCAIYIYGAKQFQERYPYIVSDVKALEEVIYGSLNTTDNKAISERRRSLMIHFFDKLRATKKELSPYKKHLPNKENMSKVSRNTKNWTNSSGSPTEEAVYKSIKGNTRYTRREHDTAFNSPIASKLEDNRRSNVFGVKELGVIKIKEKADRSNLRHMASVKNLNRPIRAHKNSSKAKESVKRQDTSKQKKDKANKKDSEPILSPKYLQSIKSKIKEQINQDKVVARKEQHSHKYASLPRSLQTNNKLFDFTEYLDNSIINHFVKEDYVAKPGNKQIWEEKIVEESSYATTENNLSMTSYESSNKGSISNRRMSNNVDVTKSTPELFLGQKFKDSVRRQPIVNNYLI